MPAGSRRYHTKSRNSCGQCRKRRVKCDLQAPICSHCRRRKELCDFLDLEAYRSFPETPNLSSQTELLAHYIDSTAKTLPLLDDFLPFWQEQVPALVKTHAFLLHSLLSISALHLGYLNPHDLTKYSILARSHYLKATQMFRADIVEVDEENCAAIFAFSIMSAMFHFKTSLPSKNDEVMSAEDYLQPLLALRSSVRLIRGGLADFVARAPLIRLKDAVLTSSNRPETVDVALLQQVEDVETAMFIPAPEGFRHKSYAEALDLLRESFKLFGTSPRIWDHIARWPFSLPQDFFNVLANRDTTALMMFNCWCRFVRNAPARWYWDRWADKAMDCVERIK